VEYRLFNIYSSPCYQLVQNERCLTPDFYVYCGQSLYKTFSVVKVYIKQKQVWL